MYTPGQAAQQLGIDPSTLRRWAQLVAPLLSPGARVAHATRRGSARSYTDADMAVLREIQALLTQGLSLADIRAQLIPDTHTSGTTQAHGAQEVIPLDESPSAEPSRELASIHALLAAHESLIASQRQHIAELQLRVDQARDDMQRARENHQADRATWAETRDFLSNERARLAEQLDQAHADEQRALNELRSMIGRIPRWLRSWLKLGI